MSISERFIKTKMAASIDERNNISSKLLSYIEILKENEANPEFFKLIPTLIVASNESFFKEEISSLIDSDNVYFENSKSLIRKENIKPDFNDILNISQENITPGNLIAFSLKYSSFETIFSNLTAIAGIDVFSKYLEEPFSISEYIDDTDEILENTTVDRERIFKNLKEVYEIRHLICHDFLNSTNYLNLEYSKVKSYLIDAYLFQALTMFILSEHVYIPQNSPDLIDELSSKTKILEECYKELLKTFSEKTQVDHLEANKKIFKDYVLNDALSFGQGFKEYHKDFPFEILINKHKLDLIEFRIRTIKKYLDEIR
jgi:hypothetical protein